MIIINIFIGIILLCLTKIDAQHEFISISVPSEHCEKSFILPIYVNETLYTCIDVRALNDSIKESTKIEFSIEDEVEPVNTLLIRLSSTIPSVCSQYFPRDKELKICIKTSTTHFNPNYKQQLYINRAIYYGNIKYMKKYVDDQVWPISHPVKGSYQKNWYTTNTLYSVLKNETVQITALIERKNFYIVKFTIEEEEPGSSVAKIKRWKKDSVKYLLNRELNWIDSRHDFTFVAERNLNFRIYFYTFLPIRMVQRADLDIYAGVKFGNPERGDSKLRKISNPYL